MAKTGKITKWSDVVNYLIDQYLNDAKQDMIKQSETMQKKQRFKIESLIIRQLRELP